MLGYQWYNLGEPPILADGKGYNYRHQRPDRQGGRPRRPGQGGRHRRLRAARRGRRQPGHQGPTPTWIKQNYVEQQGLTFEQGKALVDDAGTGAYYPIDAKSTALFQKVADGLLATGGITTAVDISTQLDPRYNDLVTAQNEADGITLPPL